MTQHRNSLGPAATEAEKAILRCVIEDNDSLAVISNLVDADSFAHIAHQEIYRAMLAMRREQVDIDEVTLAQHLSQNGKLKQIGGPLFIAKLVTEADVVGDPAGCCREIVQVASRRALIDLYQQGADTLKTDKIPEHTKLFKTIGRAQNDLMQCNSGSTASPEDTGERLTMADLEEQIGSIQWLWPQVIPIGQITLLAAEPGQMKSAIAMWLVKIATQAGRWPDGQEHYGDGCILWAETEARGPLNLQRAKMFDVDKANIVFPLPAELALEDFRADAEKHMNALHRAAEHYHPKLIVLDALRASHRGAEKDSEINSLMADLRTVARDNSVPMLVCHHLRKSASPGRQVLALDDVRGSTSIVAASASVLAIDSPDQEDTEHKRLLHIKSNYSVRANPVGFRWKGNEIVFGPPPAAGRKTVRRDAAEAIRDLLSNGKSIWAQDGYKALQEEGHHYDAIKSAASELARNGEIVRESVRQASGPCWTWKIVKGN